MAPRRDARGRPGDRAGALRRRSGLLATLPAPPGRRLVLRRADDRASRRARPPGREGDDLPRPSEDRAPRTSRSRDRSREPQRRGAGPPSPARLASPRGSALLVPVGRPGRAQGPPRRVAPQPRPTVRADLAPDPARTRRSATAGSVPSTTGTRSTTRRSPAGSRTARSRSTPVFATCCVRCATRTGASSCPATGRHSRSPGRAPSRTRHTPPRRPSSSRSTASSAPSSACVRSSERLGALERGALRSARRLARR